ncbi:putative ferric-chelate reductase 1 [Littorina saxatilis]|uniref:putative ferric-chelate reductase 1 n=1 Tax=Littorina saxatilis TaxID=31220 RepID=UPI0038B61CAF
MKLLLLMLLCLMPPQTRGILRKSSECSESLGCISNPESNMMLTWQPTSQHVHFTLRGYIGSGDVYVAMGLSHDERMGDDDVTDCVHYGGLVQVFSSYNTGRSNRRFVDGGLLNQSGIYESGTIQCSFTRPVRGSDVTIGPHRHSLDQPWNVLLVWGHLMPGTDQKMQHDYVSALSTKVDFQAVGSFETQKLTATLVHLHGSLMLIAWVTLTSIGVIMARHYKGLLPDTELVGKHVWFQVHRALMMLVVLLTACGIIVIFVEVGGYSEAGDKTDMFPLLHPVLGLVVTGLSVLNPILAVFRPAPTAPRRPIFNWVHRCVGTGSHIVGVLTIFFGLKLKKAAAPVSMVLVLGAFVAWHVTMEIIFFSIVYVRNKRSAEDKRRDSGRSYSVQEKQEAEGLTRRSRVTGFQELLLMLHSAVAIATVIFLLALLLPEHAAKTTDI